MECHVCYNPYNTSSRKPKNLPCGHTYCAECLSKLLNVSTSTIVCPKDRQNCSIVNGKVEELLTNFALLDLLPDDCVDCHEKPQDGPCLPEHCSKRLCSDCKTSHLKKFSVELVAELQAMRKEVSEQQAMCDDDSALTRMVDQSKAAIAEVIRVFDAEKQKLIDAIEKKKEIVSSNYFQWKKNFNLCLAQSRSVMDKVSSEIQQEGDSQSSNFLSDVKKQITQEKEAIAGVERTKDELPVFNASEVQQVLDRTMPALYESIMPLNPLVPIMPLTPLMSLSPDYTSTMFDQSYGKKGSGAGEFQCPFGVASSPVTGNLALSDYVNHRIHILTSDLTPVRVFGMFGSGPDQFWSPIGVCFSAMGSMFIADENNHRIKRVKEDGEHIQAFGSQGSGVDQFQYPRGICWENGLLYVCDRNNSRIQVMRETGEHVRFIGSAPGQFASHPWFVAASAQHNKLVVSDEFGNLYLFSLDGQHKQTMRAGKPPYNIKAAGVMIDELGQIIVSDRKERCVVILGEDQVITTIRLPAGERMGDPWGVTMTLDGSIIVCDWSKHQIHKFTVPRHK